MAAEIDNQQVINGAGRHRSRRIGEGIHAVQLVTDRSRWKAASHRALMPPRGCRTTRLAAGWRPEADARSC